ncbi:hypothetical protein CDO52_04915 [Nocardiopsis gilva YIM 90087]|uniref:Fenitrothion hydrolase n=1 Tax=Nocardiopsis gilva YIM 90087 TaxID=1235441 RepID=A0A223S267_9ACTN|nr:hypothetical protein [Nocardiopsis gilva]ASU82214.1 hypothetical protein CDO52_04915 [Nocardiopsis gilva YIM 90087]
MNPNLGLAVDLAHGIGGRDDLPLPLSHALTGAAVAVVVSFVAAGLLWRTPRRPGDTAGRPLPPRLQSALDGPVIRWGLRLLGLAAAVFAAVAAVLGRNDALNPVPGFVYVFLWVGLVPASLLFGPVWRLLNPLRTVHLLLARLTRTPPDRGLWRCPDWLGYWPAAAGLLAFTWLELVWPHSTDLASLRLWFAAYAAVQLLGALAFGNRWFDRADAFEVYSTLIGRLAPLGRRGDGRLVLRGPFSGLDGMKPVAGITATVSVMLGSTAFDSLASAPWWIGYTQTVPLPGLLTGTLGLVGMALLAAALLSGGALLAGVIGGRSRAGLPSAFAPSVIPVATGYLIAHYFSLFLFEGQRTLILASDPLGTGANLFGTAERGVEFSVVSPETIALVQVGAVVAGHVVGVVAAHDRAIRLFAARRAVLTQLPLLVLMVAYTVGGLALLFAT